ncbi:MAG: transcription-repair coupling factor [Eubacterium sp.]|nr:transcription-repair coupling factor [Eubacterium sp.]
MTQLLEALKNRQKIVEMTAAAKRGERVNLSNIKTGLKDFLGPVLKEALDRSVLFLTYSDKEARRRAEVLTKLLGDGVYYYPLESVHDYFSDAHSQEITQQRIAVIKALLSGEKCLVVTSVDALAKKLLPREEMAEKFFTIGVGDVFDIEDLVQLLVNLGYERVYQVESRGQFALRGGILDVLSVASEAPVRIEFFDDEVDTIRTFDLTSQLSQKNLEAAEIAPAAEIVLPPLVREDLKTRLHKKYGADPLYLELLEKFDQEGAEHDGALFAMLEDCDCLLDYMGEAAVILDEYTHIKETYDIFIKKAWTDYETLIQQGFVLPEEKNRFFRLSALEDRFDRLPTVKANLFGNRFKKGLSLDMNAVELESFAGELPLFLDFINRRLTLDYEICFCCRSETTRETVKNYLTDQGIFSFVQEGPGIRFFIGELSEGFELADEKITFINASEIFKEKRAPRKRRRPKGRKIDSFSELHVGDYVVHDTHGIGIYRGIEQMEIGEVTKDLMVIEYDGDARLYIPIEQMDSVQVYIGTGGDKKPKVNRLGNPDWQKTKSRAKKAVEDMADELIALYAKRREMKGYAFGPDTTWQQEFEDDFAYEETEDQLRCIDEIKGDMESEVPMDRLLCGDVGYGKTEVAIRAAFKAIMEGKQVAMLVPTTILAQQHYSTVLNRFRKYPVTVEVLSRFRTASQQRKVIRELQVGKVDMIIGTHRILSKDVKFKDLGLLIIDEEQRFGVRSKEKIKQMKENIDVLTLSATPIPRTLHMSMTGVRDMSVIEEPPTGRRPVQTYVMAYNPLVIKDAITRELARDGQVYVVHNRVYDIHEVALEVQRLVPDARIAVAHGRMSGNELEEIMLDFLNHEFDVLVTTTIVESGLDVKNANTIIVDNGDCFGLSQLYQIRGRVGRSDRQAYAYVTHKKQSLTELAEKRLKAIKDFTAFGSGFRVAMRDLEIRGAGNLLGAEQSGHLFKIGYELYCRILEEAISHRMTGTEAAEVQAEPLQIHLNVDGYIPAQYINSEETKYDIYKKLTYIRNYEDYDDFEAELLDRFGDIPDGVYNLMAIAMIKNMAAALGVTEIRQRGQTIFITFKETETPFVPAAEVIPELIEAWKIKFKAGKTSAPCWSIQLKGEKDSAMLKELISFFEKIAGN